MYKMNSFCRLNEETDGLIIIRMHNIVLIMTIFIVCSTVNVYIFLVESLVKTKSQQVNHRKSYKRSSCLNLVWCLFLLITLFLAAFLGMKSSHKSLIFGKFP